MAGVKAGRIHLSGGIGNIAYRTSLAIWDRAMSPTVVLRSVNEELDTTFNIINR